MTLTSVDRVVFFIGYFIVYGYTMTSEEDWILGIYEAISFHDFKPIKRDSHDLIQAFMYCTYMADVRVHHTA